MTNEPRTLAGGQRRKQVIHRVMCSRTPGTATAYLIDLEDDGTGTIRAKEPVRHETNGSVGEAAKPLTVARLRSRGTMDRTCCVCRALEIAICTRCGTTSCGTNGTPWTCPTCQDHQGHLNLTKTGNIHATARTDRTALDHAKNGNPRLSTERRDQLPPSSNKRLPKGS